ncbi:hypothetical protein [Chromobacterium haemolyticum]|uniref:hypothetical protein n=1 Tax=Chromobacterium haemolyticum TaxID=394935 RepID=UPI001131E336|nr:hypothetical protein [Chromobacterium haemolyticum]
MPSRKHKISIGKSQNTVVVASTLRFYQLLRAQRHFWRQSIREIIGRNFKLILLFSPLLQVFWQDPSLLLKLVASTWVEGTTRNTQFTLSLTWAFIFYGWIAWQRQGLQGSNFAVWMQSLPIPTPITYTLQAIKLLEAALPLLLLYVLAYYKTNPEFNTVIATLLPWLFADTLITWLAYRGYLIKALFAISGRALLGALHLELGLGCLLLSIAIPTTTVSQQQFKHLPSPPIQFPVVTLAYLMLQGLWHQGRAALFGRLMIGLVVVSLVWYASNYFGMSDRAWGLSVVGSTIILIVLYGLHDSCQELTEQGRYFLLSLPISSVKYTLARTFVVTLLAAILIIPFISAQIKLLNVNSLAGLLTVTLSASFIAGQIPLHWQSWRMILVYGGFPLAMFSTWYLL